MLLFVDLMLFSKGYILMGCLCAVLYIMMWVFLFKPEMFSGKPPKNNWWSHLSFWRRMLFVICALSVLLPGFGAF